jgi:hypothetical protein
MIRVDHLSYTGSREIYGSFGGKKLKEKVYLKDLEKDERIILI